MRKLARALGRDEEHRAVLGQRGVRIFRVDNPHTKPVAFWEYLIEGVRKKYPDAIFLAVDQAKDDESAGDSRV